jgi:hypothetical protein
LPRSLLLSDAVARDRQLAALTNIIGSVIVFDECAQYDLHELTR